MKVLETKNKTLIKDVVTNPVLFKMLGYSGNPEDFRPNLNDTWLHISYESITVGLFHVKEFTKITAECHAYILPEYHGKGVSISAAEKAIDYLKKNSEYRTLMTMVPMACEHVFKFLKRIDFKPCGLIKNSIVYNDQLQDMVLLERGV